MPYRTLHSSSQTSLLALGFAVMLITGVLSVWLVRQAQDAGEAVTHTFTVTNLLSTLRADLRRAESGQRGFLLTGDERYLADYSEAEAMIRPALGEIAAEIVDNPVQQQRIEMLRKLVESKLAEMAGTIAQQRAGNVAAALEIVASGEGLAVMTRIFDTVSAAASLERQLLNDRLQRADRAVTYLFMVNGFGVLVIAGLGIASFLLIRRGTRALVAAHAALQQSNVDLEERVALRTADVQEANDEIQRFAYIVSHDLRAPLVNIMGFTSELEALRDDVFGKAEAGAGGDAPGTPPAPAADPALRKDFDEALHFIKSSIAKMDRLINAILNLSRAGRREFSAQPLDLNELVGAIVADFGHRVQNTDTQIAVGRFPIIVNDRLAVEQIVSNLVDNAVKYLRDGVPGRIEITAEDKGTTVILRVADNGRGIETKDRERIFELFRRAGAQDRPGEGIGLAHVRALVRRIGGTIRVESEPGEGSTFLVRLPRAWKP